MNAELRVRIKSPTNSQVRILEKIGDVMRQTLPGAEVEVVKEDALPFPPREQEPLGGEPAGALGGNLEATKTPALPLADKLDLSDLPPITTNVMRWKWEFIKNKLSAHFTVFAVSIVGIAIVFSAIGKEPPKFVPFLGAVAMHVAAYFLGFIDWLEKSMLEGKVRSTTCPSCHTAFALEEGSVLLSERQILKRYEARIMRPYNEETRQKITYCKHCNYRVNGKVYKTGNFE